MLKNYILIKMHVKFLFCYNDRRKCPKHETYAKLHRFHILFILSIVVSLSKAIHRICGSRILSTKGDKNFVRNRVFDYHLSLDWRQMAIKNTDFDPCSSIVKSVFNCCLSGVSKEFSIYSERCRGPPSQCCVT